MLKLYVLIVCVAAAYGRQLPRIIGGDEVPITAVPYIASLHYEGLHVCAGVVIDEDTILTAAQCANGKQAKGFVAVVGSKNLNGNEGGLVYLVKDLKVSQTFSTETMDDDVAILKTTKPIHFNSKIKSIELQEDGVEVPAGSSVQVSGWGATKENGTLSAVLRRTTVKVVAADVCAGNYGPKVTGDMLCAADAGKDACTGDVGGPLVYNDKLVGLVSWGAGCARPRKPGVYTKISAVRKWIEENRKDDA